MIKIEENGNYVSIDIPDSSEREFDVFISVKAFNVTVSYDLLVEKRDLVELKSTLQEIYENFDGECELRQRYEPNFIRFKGTKTGLLLINGEHVDYKNGGNECKFNLQFDQTFIPDMLKSL